MASRATRNPDMVIRIGERLLDYLEETKHYRLCFQECQDPELRVYTDSSFAPSSGRSYGCAAVFYGTSPIIWRSARQQLMTLSTAESELLESIEGSILGISTKGLLEELRGGPIPLFLHVDNMAACSLLTTATGSWRTRHLRLRSNWLKEKIQTQEVRVRHEPGETQCADIGTKPFTKERLRQLVALWGIVDRRPTREATSRALQVDPTWLQRLLLLCQVCGTRAEKPDIEHEIPWDLYLAVTVLAIAVIGLWEAFKSCARSREVRLRALKAKAAKASKAKLTKSELKELQRLIAVDPEDLQEPQKLRLVELQEQFQQTMPQGCSPVPTCGLQEDPTMPEVPWHHPRHRLGTSNPERRKSRMQRPRRITLQLSNV